MIVIISGFVVAMICLRCSGLAQSIVPRYL